MYSYYEDIGVNIITYSRIDKNGVITIKEVI